MGDPKFFPRNHILGNPIGNQSASSDYIRNNFRQKSSGNCALLYFFRTCPFISKFECFFYVVTSEVKSKPVLKN